MGKNGCETAIDLERGELEAVLASKAFARAPNVSRILRYVCERSLSGDAASIKEYNIAVEALRRPASFSPDEDSIVRVEFSRLRRNLARYYETEGAGHELRIVLPPSGYVPQFVPNAGTPAPASEGASQGYAEPETPAPRRKAHVGGAVAALALSVTVVFLLFSNTSTRGAGPVSARPPVPKPAAPTLAPGPELRIRMGVSGPTYRDGNGRAWLPDKYFTGGEAVARPDRIVRGTLDPSLYWSFRQGDFTYDIPAKPGMYELHLHFVETVYGQEGPESSGDNDRVFDVALNGKTLLSRFDIVLDAGGANIADERVFKDVSPAQDGFIHLKFSAVKNKPTLCAIELLQGIRGRMRPVRIAAGVREYWDSEGQMWGPDRYFLGGRTQRYWGPVANTRENGLYAGERFGAFAYAIPVPDGRYKLTLKFVEHWFGPTNAGKRGGVGTRVFDVYANGVALLRGFDIAKEAKGEARALDSTFYGLTPNGQGKLVVSFVPILDYPCVSAIEVVAND